MPVPSGHVRVLGHNEQSAESDEAHGQSEGDEADREDERLVKSRLAVAIVASDVFPV